MYKCYAVIKTSTFNIPSWIFNIQKTMNEEQQIFNVQVLCCYKNFNIQNSKLNIQNFNKSIQASLDYLSVI